MFAYYILRKPKIRQKENFEQSHSAEKCKSNIRSVAKYQKKIKGTNKGLFGDI